MKIIRENSSVSDVGNRDIIKTSFGDRPKDTNYFFKQDGLFLTQEEAVYLWKVFHKNPIECDSLEEWQAIKSVVHSLEDELVKCGRIKKV